MITARPVAIRLLTSHIGSDSVLPAPRKAFVLRGISEQRRVGVHSKRKSSKALLEVGVRSLMTWGPQHFLAEVQELPFLACRGPGRTNGTS
jgi:hypothetical protein